MILLAAVLAGCTLGGEPLLIAASAPKASNAMTIFLATDSNFFDKYRDLQAEYEIRYGDRLIYPPTGEGASFDVKDRRGTAVVPYELFVVGNGEYDVIVRYGGESARVRVSVGKWVDYVWVRPFDLDTGIRVEAALSSATGARPEDRILAQGELILTIRYHGQDGTANVAVGQVNAITRNDRIATSVAIPDSRLTQGAGYYSFDPLFHNQEARDNLQVTGDPTMQNARPPANWIYLDR